MGIGVWNVGKRWWAPGGNRKREGQKYAENNSDNHCGTGLNQLNSSWLQSSPSTVREINWDLGVPTKATRSIPKPRLPSTLLESKHHEGSQISGRWGTTNLCSMEEQTLSVCPLTWHGFQVEWKTTYYFRTRAGKAQHEKHHYHFTSSPKCAINGSFLPRLWFLPRKHCVH